MGTKGQIMLQPIPLETIPTPATAEPDQSAVQRAVLTLFDRWGLTDEEARILLGGVSKKTIQGWRGGEYGRVGRDLSDRMSHILGIHKSLRILFADPQRGYRWIRAENEGFGGTSALDILKQGGLEDIVRIRDYLDAVRGGW